MPLAWVIQKGNISVSKCTVFKNLFLISWLVTLCSETLYADSRKFIEAYLFYDQHNLGL